MTVSTSLEGLRSFTRKFIMLSDLIIRLQPRKKMPNITVRESTHSTAICTTRMTKSLRSSCSSTRDPPPSAVTTSFVPLPEYVAKVSARVWLPLKSAPWVTSKKEPFMFPCEFPANRLSTSAARRTVSAPRNLGSKWNFASCEYSGLKPIKKIRNYLSNVRTDTQFYAAAVRYDHLHIIGSFPECQYGGLRPMLVLSLRDTAKSVFPPLCNKRQSLR